jgi:hypothetical protein
MIVLAFLSDPSVVKRVLIHLKLPTSPPPVAPARLPEQEDMFWDQTPTNDVYTNDDTDELHETTAQSAHQHAARGPPP